MILRNYPEEISSIKKNFIVHFLTDNAELNNHVSPLSIKCSMKGNEKYKTPDGIYNVSSGNYLILNEGQQCESYIDSHSETFSVYLKSDFVNEFMKTIITPGDKILDFSFFPHKQPVVFFEKLYNHNNIVSPILMKIRLASKVDFDDEHWLKEQYCELLEKLIILHREIYKEIEKLPPVKLSTKTELYKRVCKAKEFIDSNFMNNISLEKTAKEACLSRFHFLRIFKSVFKITPHQYITKKRMEKASHLLRSSDMSVTEVCFEIGFESLSTFSWMFKNKFGLSPDVFREDYRKFIYRHNLNK